MRADLFHISMFWVGVLATVLIGAWAVLSVASATSWVIYAALYRSRIGSPILPSEWRALVGHFPRSAARVFLGLEPTYWSYEDTFWSIFIWRLPPKGRRLGGNA